MFQKILLAWDGSEHSKRAAEKAVELTKIGEESLLEIIYVLDGEKAKSEVLQNWNSADIQDLRLKKFQWIEDFANESGIKYSTKTLYGEPGPSIVKYANKENVDLVIIGSRGLNALQEFVLGSVSHKVAKRANCPVMIVK